MEPPPGDLRIDGDLREWTADYSRPLLQVPLVQVAGSRPKKTGGTGTSGRFWIALDAGGLAVAGEVRDDRVLFARKESERLTSDHVEVWIAFPGLTIPPQQIESCVSEESTPPEPDCAVWRASQKLYEAYLQRLFVRQYSLSPLGAREDYLSGAETRESFGLPFPARPSLEGSKVAFMRTLEGYYFEAWLPVAALPATAELPLRQVRVLVDVVDNDEGYQGQESFLSVAPGRRFGNPATFLPARLLTPVRLASPDGLADLLLGLTPATRFVLPAEMITTVYAVAPPLGIEEDLPWNGPRPNGHPPWIVPLPLAEARGLAKLGEVEMAVIADGGWVVWGYDGEVIRRAFRLVTRRAGSGWIASLPLGLIEGCPLEDSEGGACQVFTWERPPGLHILLIDQTSQSSAGRGACGGCPVTEYEMVALDPAGRLRQISAGNVAGWAGLPVIVVSPSVAGAHLDEASEKLFLNWPDAKVWLRAHPSVGRRTFPTGFVLAFVSGAPWDEAGPIRVVTLGYDEATGRYATSEIVYDEPATPNQR